MRFLAFLLCLSFFPACTNAYHHSRSHSHKASFSYATNNDEQIPYGSQCGVERWAVKTMRDPQSSSISMNYYATTIHQLIHTSAPSNPDDLSSRMSPVETTLWQIHAQLLGYKIEADGDYHLVLKDPQTGESMIAEIPATYCVASRANLYAKGRQTIDAIGRHAATKRWWWLDYRGATPPTITLVGVGFFDRIHAQNGVAPNGVELHPVLLVTP